MSLFYFEYLLNIGWLDVFQERAMYENLADLFSIIVTTEHLENAYVRDCVSADEYVDMYICGHDLL